MKKIIYVFLVSVLILVGCGVDQTESPTGDSEDILRQAFESWKDVYSGGYELTLDGTLIGTDGESPLKMEVDGSLDGIFDLNDPVYPELEIHVKGEIETDGESDGPFDFEVRTDGRVLYALISKFPDAGGYIPSELASFFVGQWWEIPLPDGFFANAPLELWTNKNVEGALTPGEQEMKALLDNTKFFKNIEYLGTSRVRGEQTHHYSTMMDKAAVTEFINQASRIDTERITKEDLSNFANTLNASDFDVEIYVGVDDMIMRKISGVFNMDVGNGGKMEVDFELITEKLNKDVDIAEPMNAQEIDPFAYMKTVGSE
jgi:hypothetical protein